MFLLSRKLRQFTFVSVGLTLTLLSSGCGALMKHRHANAGKACLGEMLGVEDPAFYGHTKTCWRTWNDDAWSAISCPVYLEIPAEALGSTSPLTEVEPARNAPMEQSVPEIERCFTCSPVAAPGTRHHDVTEDESDLGKFSPVTTGHSGFSVE